METPPHFFKGEGKYANCMLFYKQEYIEIPKEQRIPNSQYQKLLVDAADIETEFSKYLEGFIKAAKKGRIDKEPLYRESALANYLKELKVIETDK